VSGRGARFCGASHFDERIPEIFQAKMAQRGGKEVAAKEGDVFRQTLTEWYHISLYFASLD